MANFKGYLKIIMFSFAVVIFLVFLFESHYVVNKIRSAKVNSVIPPNVTVDEQTRSGTSSIVIPRRHAVVCMIFTTPDNWSTKGRAVRLTWAKRCPFVNFFYSSSAASEQHEIRKANSTVALDVPEGRDWLTDKTLAALRYSLDKYGDEADWFLKADDDTYVVWENLEYLLDGVKKLDAPPSYMGRKWMAQTPKGYNSGGGGYLVSKKGVELIVREGPKKSGCPQSGGIEDADIARCLAEFGIYPANTVDDNGRLKFHSHNPLPLLEGDNYHVPYYQLKPTSWESMLSEVAVTFHYVTPGQILMFDYLLYHIHRGDRSPIEFSKFRYFLRTVSPELSPVSTTSMSPSVTVKHLNRTETSKT